MQDFLKPFFKSKKEIERFEQSVDASYQFGIHYYNDYILKFLEHAPEFVEAGIGFSNGDNRRFIVELYEFADLYHKKGSADFKRLHALMVMRLGLLRFEIDDSYGKGDKVSFAKNYTFYFNTLVNIGTLVTRELVNEDLLSYEYKPMSDENIETRNSEIFLYESKRNKEKDIKNLSPEEEVEEYLCGERSIDELSPDAETWLYEEVDDD